MLSESSRRSISDSDSMYRRHFGCSILNLTELNVHKLPLGEELSPANVTIYQPKYGQELNFSRLHEAIAFNRVEEIEVVAKTKGIALGLALYEGDREVLLKREGKLEGVCKTLRGAMSGVIGFDEARNDLYISLTGGDFSQDTKKAAKNVEVKVSCLTDHGAPVKCLVRGSGPQAKKMSEYRSTVYYHTNSPPLNETVKMVINEKFEHWHLLFTFFHCSGSKPRTPFGFSFLKLTDLKTGTALKDGEHICQSYKLLEGMGKGKAIKPEYLQGDKTLLTRSYRTGLSKQDEVLRVKTTMCSTKITQNTLLYNLMNWRWLPTPENLLEVLTKCPAVLTHDEIFTFLKEIIDALCDMLVEYKSSNPIKYERSRQKVPHDLQASLKAFRLLVYVLAQFSNNLRRHSLKAYRNIIETYIKDDFKNRKIYKILPQFVSYYMDLVQEEGSFIKSHSDDFQVLENLMSSFNYVVWLIKASKKQDSKTGDSETTEQFKNMMMGVTSLMELDKPSRMKIVRGKTLKHFPSVIDQLLDSFSLVDVSLILKDFLHVAPWSKKSGPFNEDKLALVQYICESEVLKDSGARQNLLGPIVDAVEEFLRPDELDERDGNGRKMHAKCVRVVLIILQVVQEAEDSFNEIKAVGFLLPNLASFIKSRLRDLTGERRNRDIFADPFDERICDGATAMLSLLHMMDVSHYSEVLGNENEDDPESYSYVVRMREHVILVLDCLRALWEAGKVVYPSSWVVIHVFQAEVTVKLLKWTNDYLIKECCSVEEENDDGSRGGESGVCDLRDVFYDIAMQLVISDKLSVEDAGDEKRRYLLSNAYNSDLRTIAVDVLRQNWENTRSQARVRLADVLVNMLLSNVGSKHEEIATMCKHFFFDLLKCEFLMTGDFARVRDHAISSVRAIVTAQMMAREGEGAMPEKDEGKGGEQGGEGISPEESETPLFLLFKNELEMKLQDSENLGGMEEASASKFQAEGLKFLEEIKQLYTLEVALAKFEKTAANEQERCFAYSRLMDYLLKMNRKENYTRYAHLMSQEMTNLGFNVEAGEALLMHANLLEWDDEILGEFKIDKKTIFQKQMRMERKETLLYSVMVSFCQNARHAH